MAIDTSGEFWVGSEADDIREYLKAYEAEGYAVDAVRICRCGCGSDEFALEADRDEGCGQRICAHCGAMHLICDSGEHWEEAEPESWQCTECGCETCNLGVGFSLYEADKATNADVRWISIGNRCSNCGTLGNFVDWKVGYGPSSHLIEQA